MQQLSLPEALKAKNYESALLIAARLDNRDLIEQLLPKVQNIHCTDAERNTALHIAARCGATDVCKLLLEAGLYINFVNLKGETAIGFAVSNQKYATARYLLERGALPVMSKKILRENNLELLLLFQKKLSDPQYTTKDPKLAQLIPAILNKQFRIVIISSVQPVDLPPEPCTAEEALHASYAVTYEHVKLLCESNLPIVTIAKLCNSPKRYLDTDPSIITELILWINQKYPGILFRDIIITSLSRDVLRPLNMTVGYLVDLEMRLKDSLDLQGSQAITVKPDIAGLHDFYLNIKFTNVVETASLQTFLTTHEIPFTIENNTILRIDVSDFAIMKRLEDLFQQPRQSLLTSPQAAACCFFPQVDKEQRKLILQKLKAATGGDWKIGKGRECSMAFIELVETEDLSKSLPKDLKVEHKRHAQDGAKYLQIKLDEHNLAVLDVMSPQDLSQSNTPSHNI